MTGSDDVHGPYLPPGTPVQYNGGGGPEYGVVIHCWHDEEIDAHDCYVAFFGHEQPAGKPAEIPYVLRYPSIFLKIIDADKPTAPCP